MKGVLLLTIGLCVSFISMATEVDDFSRTYFADGQYGGRPATKGHSSAEATLKHVFYDALEIIKKRETFHPNQAPKEHYQVLLGYCFLNHRGLNGHFSHSTYGSPKTYCKSASFFDSIEEAIVNAVEEVPTSDIDRQTKICKIKSLSNGLWQDEKMPVAVTYVAYYKGACENPEDTKTVNDFIGKRIANASVWYHCACNESLNSEGKCENQWNPWFRWNLESMTVGEYSKNYARRICPVKEITESHSCTSSANSHNETATEAGNPIDCSTGQKVQREVDYFSAGRDPIIHERSYASSLVGETSNVLTQWSPNISRSFSIIRKYEPSFTLGIYREGGSAIQFDEELGKQIRSNVRVQRVFVSYDGGQTWQGNPNMPAMNVRAIPEGGFAVSQGGVTLAEFDNDGNAKKSLKAGEPRYFYEYKTVLAGTANERTELGKVSNRYGAYLEYFYDASTGRLDYLQDHAGVQIHYRYDAQGNLEQVIYPDNTPNDLTDNPTRTYHYGEAANGAGALPNHLTGITDENGNRFANFGYDPATGKGIFTEHAQGAERVDISYPADGETIVKFWRKGGPGEVEQLFREEKWQYGKFGGRYKKTRVEITVCNGCNTGVETWQYTSLGQLELYTDAEGRQTKYAYYQSDAPLNERYKRKSMTVGFGAIDAQGTSLEQTTEYQYNADGKLWLVHNNQATTTQYSYTSNGTVYRVISCQFNQSSYCYQ